VELLQQSRPARFAADGACVIVDYSRSADNAGVLVERTTEAGGKAFAVQADISNQKRSDRSSTPRSSAFAASTF